MRREQIDIILRAVATSNIIILAVDNGLAGKNIKIHFLENMSGGISTNGGDIWSAALGSCCAYGQCIGLSFCDDYYRSGIGDSIMPEADIARGTCHTECALVAWVTGESERVAIVIYCGDIARMPDAGLMSHFNGLGDALEEIVGYQVTGGGIDAVCAHKGLADIRAGESLEWKPKSIGHILLPLGATLPVCDRLCIGGQELIIHS